MKKKTENKIWEYMDREAYPQARKILKNHLKRDKTDYWAMTMVATTYYEEKKYKKALKWSDKAMEINDTDPLVLWDRAAPLEQLGFPEEAIKIWKQLIEWGAEKVGLEFCDEGIAWANSIINDCHYRLAMTYKEHGDLPLALEHLRTHLKHRKGTKSLYPLKEVKKELKNLENV